jgi:hypothetical protein
VLTAEAVAVKLAVVAPGATVTEAGTVKAELLLVRFTLKPAPVAAAFTATVQASTPAPVNDPLLQLTPLNTGTPVPLRLIKVEVPLVELLVTVSWPVSVPAVVGSNCTVSAAVWPGFKVSGKVAPVTENPIPAATAPVTVTAELPVEERVSV